MSDDLLLQLVTCEQDFSLLAEVHKFAVTVSAFEVILNVLLRKTNALATGTECNC